MNNRNSESIGAPFFMAGVIAIILTYVWPSKQAAWQFHLFAWLFALIGGLHFITSVRGLYGYMQYRRSVKNAYKDNIQHGSAETSDLNDLDDF